MELHGKTSRETSIVSGSILHGGTVRKEVAMLRQHFSGGERGTEAEVK